MTKKIFQLLSKNNKETNPKFNQDDIENIVLHWTKRYHTTKHTQRKSEMEIHLNTFRNEMYKHEGRNELTKSLLFYAGKCFSCRKNRVFSHYFLFSCSDCSNEKNKKTMSVKWEKMQEFLSLEWTYRTSLIVISEENLPAPSFQSIFLLLLEQHNNKQHFRLSIFASSISFVVGWWKVVGPGIRLKGWTTHSRQQSRL